MNRKQTGRHNICLPCVVVKLYLFCGLPTVYTMIIALAGLTVWRGLKAVQSLLYEARMITRQNNARYFEKSGGTFRALSDFKSVQPHEVRSMPLLKGVG